MLGPLGRLFFWKIYIGAGVGSLAIISGLLAVLDLEGSNQVGFSRSDLASPKFSQDKTFLIVRILVTAKSDFIPMIRGNRGSSSAFRQQFFFRKQQRDFWVL